MTIRGEVRGDLICFCRSLEIEGTVGGNVYGFAQWSNLRGQVGRNVYTFTQNLTVPQEGRVGENLTSFAQELALHGNIGRDANTFSEFVNVRGTIGRNFTPRSERVSLESSARVGGNLVAYVPRQQKSSKTWPKGATIVGATQTRVHVRRSRYARPRFWFWQGVQFGGAWLAGMLLAWLVRGIYTGLGTGTRMLQQAGVGFLVLCATPIAAVILAISLVGLPIALITLALWIIGIYLAKVFMAAALGHGFIRPGRGGMADLALFLLIGLLVVFVAINLPFVGVLFKLLVVLLGLGMAFDWIRGRWRQRTVVV